MEADSEALFADRLDALEQRLDAIAQTCSQIAIELEAEREVNRLQADAIAIWHQKITHRQRETRRSVETLTVGLLAFFGFCLVILTGLRLEFGWGSFALPPNLLESGAIAGGLSSGVKYFIDRNREQSEVKSDRPV